MKSKLSFLLLCLFFKTVTGQADSTMILTEQAFLHLVSKNHPMVSKAQLKIDVANQQFAAAKGSFDPELSSTFAQKYFEQTEYYSLFGASLKVPAWFGIEVYSGVDVTSGDYLNPERTLPNNGLLYAGISIPVGRDLFIDYRMYEFKKADLYAQAGAFEKQLLMNELLMDASKSYWSWFKAYHTFEIYQEAYEIAAERFSAIRYASLTGERPHIDTVEAGIHVQNRYVAMLGAQNDYEIKKQLLSTFLWIDGFIPLEMADNLFPPALENTAMKSNLTFNLRDTDSLLNEHPKMLMNQNNIDYLALEKRYRQEQLKPQLDLKYNFITEPIAGSTSTALSWNNYNWGVEFSSPLFYAEQRNQLKETRLKMEDAMLSEKLLQNELSAAFFSAKNNWQYSIEQNKAWQLATQNYQSLFEAELTLFNLGESSLFMVNSREMDMFNARIRLIDLMAQNQIYSAYCFYSLAILHQQI